MRSNSEFLCHISDGPYAFTGRYQDAYQPPDGKPSPQQVYWVYELLCSWPFSRVLEIGPSTGAASTAFVQALNSGRDIEAHFFDLGFTNSFQKIVVNCYRPNRIHAHSGSFVDVLRQSGPFDLMLTSTDLSLELEAGSLASLIAAWGAPPALICLCPSSGSEGRGLVEEIQATLPMLGLFEKLECHGSLRPAPSCEAFLATADGRLARHARTLCAKWLGSGA